MVMIIPVIIPVFIGKIDFSKLFCYIYIFTYTTHVTIHFLSQKMHVLSYIQPAFIYSQLNKNFVFPVYVTVHVITSVYIQIFSVKDYQTKLLLASHIFFISNKRTIYRRIYIIN